MPNEDVLVQVADVSKRYGKKPALNAVSFDLKAGKLVVFLGPNGSGKTTLVKIVAGLIAPDQGSVTLFHEPLVPGDESFRSRIGFLFDHSAHWEALTGWENAYFFSRSLGLDRKASTERLQLLFERLGMSAVKDDPVSTYSYGMRRKLALIETMVHRPQLLLLDEPTIGLDLTSRSALYDMLGEEAMNGSTVVVSTNDINEAGHIADEVLLISEGRLLVSGTPADLIKGLDRSTTIEIELGMASMPDPIRALPQVLSADAKETEGKHYLSVLVRSEQEEEALSEVVRQLAETGSKVRRITVRRPELGDVFLKYTGGAK